MKLGGSQTTLNTQSRKRLIKRLNEVCSLLDRLYNINSGGCCYVAYCVAKLLLNDGFNNVKLVVFSDDTLDCQKVSDLKYSYPHYAIESDNLRINCDCFEDGYYETELPVTNADSILKHYKHGCWNCIYSKQKNNYVSKVLKSFHDDFIKDLCKR